MSDFRDAVRALDLDLIRHVLELAREIYEQTGQWPTAGEIMSKLLRGPQ